MITETGLAKNSNDISLWQMAKYFLFLGATGFGGPAALCNYMYRDLVEKKGWISQEEYKEGFSLSQLAPGPLATQLAIYLGWVRFRLLGASVAGFAFVIPSFILCIVLAVFYIHFESSQLIQSIFYGVGAAVIGIIVVSSYKLFQKSVGKNKTLFSIWLTTALITAITRTENIWLFVFCGMLNLFLCFYQDKVKSRLSLAILPLWLTQGLVEGPTNKTLYDLFLFFAKAGTFVFGSGLAIVPFLHEGVVGQHRWLTEKQFIDAIAVAMITPGPVVITVAFIGFLVAGLLGAIVAAIGTFLPCYLFTVIPAPHYHKISKNIHIKSFISGITAAAVGAIAGASWILGKQSIFDIPTAVIGSLSLIALIRFKTQEPLLILGAALLGIIYMTVRDLLALS